MTNLKLISEFIQNGTLEDSFELLETEPNSTSVVEFKIIKEFGEWMVPVYSMIKKILSILYHNIVYEFKDSALH
jgi:hypothetical protein